MSSPHHRGLSIMTIHSVADATTKGSHFIDGVNLLSAIYAPWEMFGPVPAGTFDRTDLVDPTQQSLGIRTDEIRY